MNRVRILTEHVANCIAAGEVIERPSSVVKELVENAIDAEARRVEIEIVRGGRRMVRVVDDGIGMSRDDALLALERHATSKVRDLEDIESIATLGFRGEAIPSIAAVTRFLLRTREADALAGTEIRVSGGKLYDVRDAGAPPGTLVEARDLFFNLPARRKFLRSVATETSRVQQIVTMHALAHPDRSFRFVSDGRAALDLAPAASVADRIRDLSGPHWLAEMVAVERDDPAVRVWGFAGKPSLTRASRAEQRLFVNGRPVESRAVSYAVGEAYRTLVMKGRYPVVVLFLEIDPERVDVNIHPAKREVRLRDGIAVQRVLADAIRVALEGSGVSPRPIRLDDERPAPGAPPDGARPPEGARSFSPPPPFTRGEPFEPPSARPESQADVPAFPYPPGLPADGPRHGEVDDAMAAVPKPAPVPGDRGAGPADGAVPPAGLRIVGAVGDLYIVAESSEGLVLIDQHAAHERVLFDRMRRQLAGAPVRSQRLLMPETVELSERDAERLRRHLPALNRIGIEIGDFGPRAFVIESLPPDLAGADPRQLLRDVLDEVEAGGGRITNADLREEEIARTVCRHAVKARDPLTLPELRRLLDDLHATELPYTCPHGRPTMILIGYPELERKFGRRGAPPATPL